MGEAVQERRKGDPGGAFRIAMAVGLLLTLAANVPGQMSLDSVVALTEARTGVRQTWAPAVSSWILKLFDHLVAGTGLYVTASAALLFFSLMSLTSLRPRSTWLAAGLGVLMILTPQILLYQGIVWRDVLFANLTIAGFVMLAHAAKAWEGRPPILPLAGALVCLALAALARQNGLILVVAAAAVLAWTARKGGWRPALAWGLGALVAAGVLALGVDHIARPAKTPAKLRLNAASLILEHYDIVGAKAHHPRLKLKEIGKVDPAAQALIEAQAAKMYTPTRVDTLDLDETFRKTLWHVPDAAMHAQWRRIIVHYPAAYLLQRADVFRWTFLTPKLELCLPAQVGVSGPQAMVDKLGVQSGVDIQDQGLADYARKFYGTPVYSHLTWALVAVAVIVLLLRRRDPADWVFIALLGGSLAFTASFAVISVACDYRYLYLLDLAAMVGVLYTALDPPRWRKA
ncbi:MAG: hypothetical protein JWP28_2952 [Phenylobacterium sp.]|uniref:hypothetical protein n=1 Tax=Phenylobacterium sp. TaxID=1871053 RepID=UPI002636BBE6|nr:hypothetical protein [Phenylobacterium sp.]MDB5498921.1 hypothetical protein [Phenylobacterium sp.]